MSNSPILAIPEIAIGQSNKHLTHNNAIALLEASVNDLHIDAAAGTSVVLTEAQATQHFVYRFSGASAAFTVEFPSVINSNNAKRVFAVHNADAVDVMTVQSDNPGATVVVQPGATAIIYQDFEDMYAISRGATTVPYDLAFFVPSTPADAGMVFKFTAVRAIVIPDDFAGSLGHCETVPSDGTAVFSVEKNGSAVGTISINTSGVFTFATTGAEISLAVGDELSIIAPTPQDSTLADINVSIIASRTA